MGSIVLNDRERNYDCSKCIDGSNMRKQGRDEAFIAKRIRAKMLGKGCTSDAKQPVFRLTDGQKIYRCPKAVADNTGVLSAYSDYGAIRDGLYTYEKQKISWKWRQVMQTVRAELASNDKQRQIDSRNKSNTPSRKR